MILTDQKQELSEAAMFVNESELNKHSLKRTFYTCWLLSFGSSGQAVSEGNIKQNDQSETRIAYGGNVFSGLKQNEQSF